MASQESTSYRSLLTSLLLKVNSLTFILSRHGQSDWHYDCAWKWILARAWHVPIQDHKLGYTHRKNGSSP